MSFSVCLWAPLGTGWPAQADTWPVLEDAGHSIQTAEDAGAGCW